MTGPDRDDRRDAYPYLEVDRFLARLIDAQALASALETGLVDYLEGRDGAPPAALERITGMAPRGLRMLVGLLAGNGVVETADDGTVALAARFRRVLRFRDLLEAKLAFAREVLPDICALFTELLGDPAAFMAQSRVFALFRYDRCFEVSAETLAAARRWVAYTTALTRYEAAACLRHYDFAGHRRMLDIGGNSGEFAVQACRAHPGLAATVFDLPVVCEIGRAHVADAPEAGRIAFRAGDARADPLPAGHDLITFKSFLHDWPEAEALAMLRRAAAALAPGGAIVIFERAPLEPDMAPLSFAMIPNLLFLHFFRPPAAYVETLAGLGFAPPEVRRIDLEMPFHLIWARKP